MAYFEQYGVEFQDEGNERTYIPVLSTFTFSKMRLITSITGKDVSVFIRVRVVKERTVEEIDEGLKKATESFNKLHCLTPSGTKVASTEPCRDNHTRIEEIAQSLQKEGTSIQSKNIKIKEEDSRRKIAQGKEMQEQIAKENRRIIIVIIIAILGAMMLFNAKCSKTKSHHHEFFDPSMEYRHT